MSENDGESGGGGAGRKVTPEPPPSDKGNRLYPLVPILERLKYKPARRVIAEPPVPRGRG